MTINGTRAYDGRDDLPPLVAAAVGVARETGFALSCLPAQGWVSPETMTVLVSYPGDRHNFPEIVASEHR